MPKKKQYRKHTAEEFIEAWKEINPRLVAKAKELNITLENEDGSPMDPYSLFLIGETTVEKLKKAGVDARTRERMLQFSTEVRRFINQLQIMVHPAVTMEQIKAVFEQQRNEQNVQKELERNWIVLASLAWHGYKHDGRGFLVINELPPERVRYMWGSMPALGGASKEMQLLAEEIEKSVNGYNPEKEINVVLWKDGGVYIFRLSQEPSPAKAYEQRRHIMERRGQTG